MTIIYERDRLQERIVCSRSSALMVDACFIPYPATKGNSKNENRIRNVHHRCVCAMIYLFCDLSIYNDKSIVEKTHQLTTKTTS